MAMGLRGLWARWTKRREHHEEERAAEWAYMSPEERKFTSESVDDRQAELESEEHLGGGDPLGPVDS
jgi:hypothetical protein